MEMTFDGAVEAAKKLFAMRAVQLLNERDHCRKMVVQAQSKAGGRTKDPVRWLQAVRTWNEKADDADQRFQEALAVSRALEKGP